MWQYLGRLKNNLSVHLLVYIIDIIDFFCYVNVNHVEAKKGGKTKIPVVVATAALAVGFGMLLIGFYICRSRTNLKGKITSL